MEILKQVKNAEYAWVLRNHGSFGDVCFDFASGPWSEENGFVHGQHVGMHFFVARAPMDGSFRAYVHMSSAPHMDYASVHGGVTYSKSEMPALLVPYLSKEVAFQTGHWVGFDAAHAQDKAPLKKHPSQVDELIQRCYAAVKGEYRTEQYMISECVSLIDQYLESEKVFVF